MLRRLIVLLAACGAASNAAAQERPDAGWSVTLGAGGLYAPSYEGDDDYRLSALPNLQIRHGDRFFASVQEGVGYRVVNTPGLRAGPIARVAFSRKEDGDQTFAVTGDDTDDLRGLGDVDASIELGGFVEYDLGALTISAQARQAVTGHEGLVGDLAASWSGRSAALGMPLLWSVGPRAKLVDEDFNQAYFGVTAAQSAASGLAQFEAGGGLYSYGVGASAVIPLDPDFTWSAVLVAGFDRLSGDAADSPLVRERGSENQTSIGVFVSRRLF